jgi:hypothetical protein
VVLSLVLTGRDGEVFFECPLKMGLIGKTGLLRDIGDWRPFAQLRLRMLNAPVDQVGVGRHVVVLLKGADQVSL